MTSFYKSVTTANTLTRWYIDQLHNLLDICNSSIMSSAPLLFSVGGSHSSKYTAWVFPDPLTHIKHHVLENESKKASFDKVCHRFKLVRGDLEGAHVDEVKVIVGQLRNIVLHRSLAIACQSPTQQPPTKRILHMGFYVHTPQSKQSSRRFCSLSKLVLYIFSHAPLQVRPLLLLVFVYLQMNIYRALTIYTSPLRLIGSSNGKRLGLQLGI